jgi:cytochrome c oxidase assembly protein subunit 15|tara:strand:+ start:45 stop:1061 length:1017 start_codon:yes stop_codon:yes gene_type:complete
MFKNKKYYNFVSVWLISLIILVGLIIIVGGLTRLTESGLSITKWELFSGILPPTNIDQWEKYFLLYKEIPQFILLNSQISLDQFKTIFLWEYYHRLLGRLIGLFFLIPFLFLIFKGELKKNLKIKLMFVFILILIQGLIGWYMVKSGLTNNVSVSHYRLAFHLFTAFIIFTSLLWIFLNHYYVRNKNFLQINSNFLLLKILIFLIFTQIIIGAFVSGLDAGKIYQTWPLMNGSYLPSDYFFNEFFNFGNPSFVQFLHRNLAYIIFILSISLGVFIYRKKLTSLYSSYFFLLILIFLQVLLGILTLYSNLNIILASSHQISSIFLVACSLNLYYRSIRS